jgi:serine/threonine-protein kinase
MDADSASEPEHISHYRLLHSLGAGGMGEVFAAFDETLKRRVAIKAIHAQRLITPDAKARFLREAQILSRLDHPHICRVHDYLSEGGRDFLVLELVEGKSLRTAIQAGLDRPAAMKIAQQIADVLVVTHAAGIVHRDLKPGNVMLTGRGDVKVLDFGLARSLNLDTRDHGVPAPAGAVSHDDPTIDIHDIDATRPAAARDITGWTALPTGAGADFKSQTGSISGTIAYMSPEQAIGESPAAPSDMYSFGLILQEMLTGQPAFDKGIERDALLDAVRRGDKRPPAGVDADIAALINRLSSFAPTQRPTAVETAERLRWIAGIPARRVRRLAIAAAIAAIVLATAKYTIDLSRERSVAVAARQEADRRRGQAEKLIGFMLGNLRPKLEQVGRLDLLEDVGREATSYFDTVPAGTMSGEELYRRSQTIYQIGQVRQATGKLADAIAAYRESLAVAEQVAERNPDKNDWLLGVSMAHFYLGDALRMQGDLDGAMREFSAYRDIARQLVAKEPGSDQFQMELAYGHGNVAAVLEARSDLDGARRELELAQQIKEDLARRKPDDRQRLDSVATGHNRLGLVLNNIGESRAALEHFLRDAAIRKGLVERYPQDYSLRRQQSVALNFVSRAYLEQGDLEVATRYARDAADVAAYYAAVDPRNLDWQRDVGRTRATYADCLQWQGDLKRAAALYASSLAILRPIARGQAGNVARQRDLASTAISAGWLSLRQGDAAAATALAEESEQALAAQVSKGADKISARIVAESRLLAAEGFLRRGQPDRALGLREAALTLVPTSVAGSIEKRTLAAAARAQLALNRTEEARLIVDRLTRLNYRHPALVQAAAGKAVTGPP